ncbi:lipoprotein-releasing ABC transporter permease subunit [Brevundimonas aveniformis]|uniref:lipoprotein-releasing ABC transporter permease subunit n=1 Tax=Brevundimonas aveniformis TaxID=370977 RepID=UPI0004291D29|nr:lipoprotein-releasing ABC transporter permease subunit [Brevundimonas aveniformis]
MSDDVRPAGPFSAWELGLAWRYLRARRKDGGVALIAIISFLGIMLGVMVLVIVMSVMNGFTSELINRLLAVDGHVYVQGNTLTGAERQQTLQRVRSLPEVVEATPLIQAETFVTGPGGASAGGLVRGVRPDDLRASTIGRDGVRVGSLAGFGQGDYGGDTIVIGEAMAQRLGVGPGDTLTLLSQDGGGSAFGAAPLEKSYVVGAIVTTGVATFDQVMIYMPIDQAELFFAREGMWDMIQVMIERPERAPETTERLRELLGPSAMVLDWTTQNATMRGALAVERTVMRLILMLIVLVAALNIISGIVMLVKNKTRDIAIMRTMGAGQGSILRIFLAAGFSIGAAGTLIGFGLGVLFCLFIRPIQSFIESLIGRSLFPPEIYFLDGIPARIEWPEIIIIAGAALVLSALAALIPSWRASRIDPVEALRYE